MKSGSTAVFTFGCGGNEGPALGRAAALPNGSVDSPVAPARAAATLRNWLRLMSRMVRWAGHGLLTAALMYGVRQRGACRPGADGPAAACRVQPVQTDVLSVEGAWPRKNQRR